MHFDRDKRQFDEMDAMALKKRRKEVATTGTQGPS